MSDKTCQYCGVQLGTGFHSSCFDVIMGQHKDPAVVADIERLRKLHVDVLFNASLTMQELDLERNFWRAIEAKHPEIWAAVKRMRDVCEVDAQIAEVHARGAWTSSTETDLAMAKEKQRILAEQVDELERDNIAFADKCSQLEADNRQLIKERNELLTDLEKETAYAQKLESVGQTINEQVFEQLAHIEAAVVKRDPVEVGEIVEVQALKTGGVVRVKLYGRPVLLTQDRGRELFDALRGALREPPATLSHADQVELLEGKLSHYRELLDKEERRNLVAAHVCKRLAALEGDVAANDRPDYIGAVETASAMGRYAWAILQGQTPPASCRDCGCTELCACEGGCSWVEPDLCSACVKEPQQKRVIPHPRRPDVSDRTAAQAWRAATAERIQRDVDEAVLDEIKPPSRLFHGIYPTVTCCNLPMLPMGNMSLHTISYECTECRSRLEATVTFSENPRHELSAEMKNALDQEK